METFLSLLFNEEIISGKKLAQRLIEEAKKATMQCMQYTCYGVCKNKIANLYTKQKIVRRSIGDREGNKMEMQSPISVGCDLITYDATVVTGFEKLAIKEMEKKISISNVEHSMGHVFVRTTDRYDRMARLHSVDNVYVQIFADDRMNLIEASADTDVVLSNFEKIIEKCDWRKGMQVWIEASGFHETNVDTILNRKPDETGDVPTAKMTKPAFRVSCNRTGNHRFTSQEAASIFGGAINDTFHWPVSLKRFDLEILLTIKEDSFRVALCLSKESLYKRYIVAYGVTTLRGTIAYNLLQIADIQAGDIVCDPLCGSGVIPVEGAIGWPDTFVLAGDNHAVAIEKTAANVAANRDRGMKLTDISQWDCARLPLKNDSIDVFTTDLPFGRRLGSKHQNRSLYPALLAEMIRCSRVGSGRIVLLTQDKTNANRCLADRRLRQYFKHEKSFFVKIGGLDASIYLLKRNHVQMDALL